jgi:ligand-binding sensor domain-containing protein
MRATTLLLELIKYTGRSILVLLPVFPAMLTNAQSVNIRHYTVRDGLPSSIIYRCAQDQRGFMWFGTESGISRFDGKSFRNFSTRDGLTDTEILDIFCATNGELWLIPFGSSPMRFDPVTQLCHTAANDPELKKIIYKGILNITQIRDNDIFFSYTNSPGLYRYSKGKVNEVVLPGIEYKSIKSIHPLPDGKILLNIPTQNILLDLQSGTIAPLPGLQGEVIGITGDSIFSYHASKGLLYSSHLQTSSYVQVSDSVPITKGAQRVNQWGRLLYFCNNSGGLDIYDHSLKLVKTLLKDVVLNTSFMDRDGNLWLCSYTKGIYCLPVSRIRVFDAAGSLADDYVSSLLPIPGEKALTGYLSGKIQQIDTRDGTIRTLVENSQNDLSDRIRKMIYSRDNRVIGVSDKGVFYSPPANPALFTKWNPYGLISMGGKDIAEYAKGRYLVSTTHLLLNIALPEQLMDTIYPGRTTCVGAGLQGDAWFGTLNGVYYIRNIEKRQYEYYGNRNKLLTLRMNNIVQGSDGLVWMASANAGVLLLKNNEVLAQISAAQGLASDLCRNLYIEEGANKVWVATNNGVSCIRYNFYNGEFRHSINNYNTSFGLPDNDINKVSLYNGNVYAATANGLAVFPPLPPAQNIPVHVVEIQVEGKLRTIAPKLELRYFENDIRIGYTGICFTCAGNLEYRYRMLKAGSDTNWVTTDAQVVNFSALHPGRYTFQVKTATGSGITSLEFIIRRPWYGQWWFWGLCAAAIVSAIVFMYTQRIKKIAREATQARQMAQLELQALRAQMNPHFLFNSLNAIQHFISENEGTRAQNYLGSFSRLMRLFLESSRSNYISLAQEKELLSLYLELEQVRFNNRFSYSIEIDPELNIGYEIPAMLIQPFAENAVNHGLFDKPGSNGRIWIRFYRDKGDLCCEVEDNGIGRKAAALLQKSKQHISRGMQITEERLKTLEQSDGLKTLILADDKTDAEGNACGTRIIIRITDPELTQ